MTALPSMGLKGERADLRMLSIDFGAILKSSSYFYDIGEKAKQNTFGLCAHAKEGPARMELGVCR